MSGFMDIMPLFMPPRQLNEDHLPWKIGVAAWGGYLVLFVKTFPNTLINSFWIFSSLGLCYIYILLLKNEGSIGISTLIDNIIWRFDKLWLESLHLHLTEILHVCCHVTLATCDVCLRSTLCYHRWYRLQQCCYVQQIQHNCQVRKPFIFRVFSSSFNLSDAVLNLT